MARDLLVVDVKRLLDESTAGKQAARQVEEAFQKASMELEKLKVRARVTKGPPHQQALEDAQDFEAQSIRTIEMQRAQLREELLLRIRPVLLQVMKEQGARLILERNAVLMFEDELDVTHLVLAQLDAQPVQSAL